MALSWARRRQFAYISTFFFLVIVVLFVAYFIYRPEPTCFDNKQNQGEAGVDCGGSCTLACETQIKPLKVYWVRPLPVSSGRYDLVAQIENFNQNLGLRRLDYTFSLFGKDNTLIAKREGSTFVNPGEKFVIFESRIETGDIAVKKAFLEFGGNYSWEKIEPISRDIYIEKKSFNNEPKPTLNLSVGNSRLEVVRDLRVYSTLSDVNGNIFGASASIVDEIGPGETRDVYLTWPEPFEQEATFIESYWRLSAFANR